MGDVLTAIERDPKDRYQSAAELEADLQRFLDDKPIGARRASQGEQFWRWCRRNPAVCIQVTAQVSAKEFRDFVEDVGGTDAVATLNSALAHPAFMAIGIGLGLVLVILSAIKDGGWTKVYAVFFASVLLLCLAPWLLWLYSTEFL